MIRTGNDRTGNLSNFWVILWARHLKTKVNYRKLPFISPSPRPINPSVIVPSTRKQKKAIPVTSPPPPTLFLEENKARMAETIFLSQGLDDLTYIHTYMHTY